MVDFVLDDPGQKAFCLKAHFVTSGVECLNADFTVAGYFAINVADTEAAFVIGDKFTFVFNDFGINKCSKSVIGFVVKVIANNYDALKLVYLHGG